MRTRIVRTLIQNTFMNPIHVRLIRNFDWLGLGKVVGGVVDGVSTLINGKKNREAQAAENQKNREHEEKMYNLYESPAAQAQQMREAGLNPMGAIAPTSVGSVSTASLPASESPSFGSAIVEAFGMKNAKLQTEMLESQNRSANAQATIDESDAIKQAIEANDYESYYQIRKAQEEALRDKYQHEAKSAEYKKLTDEAIYNDFQTAREEFGYNQFEDAHNESTARVEKIRQDINSSIQSSMRDHIRLGVELEKHDIYKKFTDLELHEQEQLLKELLDTWDVRESLINSDKAVRTMLVNQLTRSNELQIEKHKYDMAVAKSVANAIENGDSVDAVLLKALSENPTSALAITTQLVSTIAELSTNVIKSQNKKKLVSGAFTH